MTRTKYRDHRQIRPCRTDGLPRHKSHKQTTRRTKIKPFVQQALCSADSGLSLKQVENFLDDVIDIVAWLVPFHDKDTERRTESRHRPRAMIPKRVGLWRCGAKVGKPGHFHNHASTVRVDVANYTKSSDKPLATRHDTDRVQVGAEDALKSGKTLGEVDCATSGLLNARVAANHSCQDFVEPQCVTNGICVQSLSRCGEDRAWEDRTPCSSIEPDVVSDEHPHLHQMEHDAETSGKRTHCSSTCK